MGPIVLESKYVESCKGIENGELPRIRNGAKRSYKGSSGSGVDSTIMSILVRI